LAGESGRLVRAEQRAHRDFRGGILREEPRERHLSSPRQIVEERKLDPVTRRPWNAVEERLDVVDGLRRGRAGEPGAGTLERRLALGERLGAERRQGRRFAPAGADPDLESVPLLDRAARGLQRGT